MKISFRLFLFFIFFANILFADNDSYEIIVFSDTRYPKEKKIVIKLLQKEYPFEDFSKENIPYGKQDNMITYPDSIYIGKVDLNNDNILDVVVSVRSIIFSGSHGNTVLFYLIDKNNNWKRIFEVTAYQCIAVLKKTHDGLRNIAFMSFYNGGDQKEGRIIWEWDGKEYQYKGIDPLEKKDWEVFKDEFIR